MTPADLKFLSSLSKQTNVSIDHYDGIVALLGYLVDQAEKQHRELLKAHARSDMAAFAEWIEPEWVPARHHQFMLSKLEKVISGDIPRLIISMPVAHGKSVYSSLTMPAFAFGLNPHEKIICAGHTQSFVENTISKKVRGIIGSDRYKELFPETVISNDSRAQDYFTMIPVRGSQPGHYVAKGAGTGISGYRSTLIVADDLYPNQAEANSPAFRKKVLEWWHGDLMRRAQPENRTVLVCTRWHGDDVIGNLINDMETGKGQKWETVILPAICEDPENDPLGREEGEALWPEYHTIEGLREIKASTPSKIWNTLYQCNPTNEGAGVIKEEWFQHWESLPESKMIRRRFVSFDTANSATQRSDYTVGTAWIETMDRKYYLVDIVRQRVEFTELLHLIEEFATRHNAQHILIEDAGAGKAILQSRQGKMYAPLIGIKPANKSKEFRFDEVSPLFETGAVLLPKRHEHLPDVERELLEFPFGKHDDIVDSCTHALRWARGNTVKRGTKKMIGV